MVSSYRNLQTVYKVYYQKCLTRSRSYKNQLLNLRKNSPLLSFLHRTFSVSGWRKEFLASVSMLSIICMKWTQRTMMDITLMSHFQVCHLHFIIYKIMRRNTW